MTLKLYFMKCPEIKISQCILPLRPLCKNEYSINDIQKFQSMLSSVPPLQDDEKDVSYDVESLFTNIPIQETIN